MDPVRQKAEQEKLMEARLRDKATLQRKQVPLSASQKGVCTTTEDAAWILNSHTSQGCKDGMR